MKKMFLALMLIVLLTACGGTTDTPPVDDNINDTKTYSVRFNTNGGTIISDLNVSENSNVNAPSDPTKNGVAFVGWFLDSEFNTSATWPMAITEEVTVYAKWMANADLFFDARTNTVDASEFEYDYNLSVDIALGGIGGPSAVIEGNVKYDSESTIPYYRYEELSGLILFDGIRHSFLKDNSLTTISYDTENKLTGFDSETVLSEFDFEYSVFAKVLFEYTETQISDIIYHSGSKYEIEFNGGASNIMDTVLAIIGNPLITEFIGIPENETDFAAYVNIEDGFIKSYEYDFEVESLASTLTFHYDLTFLEVGSNVTINIPSFDGLSMSSSEISETTTSINTILNNYLNQEYSEYDYNVQTHVDYPSSLSIDSTTQGRTMRMVSGSDVYFWNRVEVDSDYKNDNLYDGDIVDYERYRVMYLNGDVYEVEDGFFSNTYNLISAYDNYSVDEYYLFLPSFLVDSANISLIQESVDGDETTYSIVLNSTSVLELLEFIDDSVRIDFTGVNEFEIYNIESGFEVTYTSFTIKADSNGLVSIEMNIDGIYIGSYTDTTFNGELEFGLDYMINVIEPDTDYIVPTEDSEVELPNS
ncbi:Listeria-Bacteroides repeat domain [Candidatus Izimaplasma bacterium HR1]|uniref:InlB B-repeat-containing protein n=1 Tax=Candidatus Izimoplasma sp. HR1 TaxID=1541959 RepID=UPI0004F65052|nr:Listeria-Bacteroides repeat domain [Candidatus Izimaplasma bacterium HR1]